MTTTKKISFKKLENLLKNVTPTSMLDPAIMAEIQKATTDIEEQITSLAKEFYSDAYRCGYDKNYKNHRFLVYDVKDNVIAFVWFKENSTPQFVPNELAYAVRMN